MGISSIKKDVKRIFFFFSLFTFYFSLFTFSLSAQNNPEISADRIEYIAESNTYVAQGSVTIIFEDAILSADKITLDGNTQDAAAVGNVTYRDAEAEITAQRIELNLKTKTGTIYDSYLFYKKQNFHVHSGKIRKTGDKSFTLDEAVVTTCDADPPEWHIYSKDISITQNEKLTGWHGTFNVSETPILYTPYLWAPLNRDRQSGFLFPSFGYSSERGYYYKQGFFWAAADNQDATIYLDYYDDKGFGEGLDYRYIFNAESDGELWIYHVEDKDPEKDLYEVKAYHNQKLPYNIEGYLKVHAVSHSKYYETMDSTSADRFGLSSWESTDFGFTSEERLQKYLESNLQVAKPFSGGRTYLLAQGRQSLEESSEEIPQSLPEIALMLNTRSHDFFSYNLSAKAVNFWREEGREAVRLDLNPDLFFSYGRLFNITQKIGLRETAYFLSEPSGDEDRFIYDLNTTFTTTLFKKYETFVHVIEPLLMYTYVPDVDQDAIPVFDSTDFIPETSAVTYALTNRISGIGSTNLEARFRLSQSYSFLGRDNHFSPLSAEASLSNNRIVLSTNASYDIEDEKLTEFIGSVRLKGDKGYVGTGKNFRRSTDLDQYTFEAGIYRPINIGDISLPIDLSSKLWYDVENERIQQLDVVYSYKRQCWGYSITYSELPDKYEIIFALEFPGLGSFSLGSI
jgi:LPS-assembly protein